MISMPVKNKVQLITYPDLLGGNLALLNQVIEKHFKGLFACIHILPPFPSSQDRGFSPLTHLEIDPQFGSWNDIAQLGKKHDILLDLVLNHVSSQSGFFQDFLMHGRKSPYADLFITLDKIWPSGEIDPGDFEQIFLRREEPYSTFTIQDTGEAERVWTTFGKTIPSGQIDLDINSQATRELLRNYLATFSQHGVKIVRLDAIGYVIKKPGTSFFFVEPEIYEFLDWLKAVAVSYGLELLPEVHSEYGTQLKLAEHGNWIYDFILPYLVLHTLIARDSSQLLRYLHNRPQKQFTMLDCHDGVPIKPDLNGMYIGKEARKLVDTFVERGSNLSLIYSPTYKDPDGFDVHQIRGTYYSMLGCDDNAYIAARAIQFFTPGVPQVYYVGLLAGTNDEDGYKKTGDGREINRHNYTLAEIGQATGQEVVQRLLRLIELRNTHPAFDGDFRFDLRDATTVKLYWVNGEQTCSLELNLADYETRIEYTEREGGKTTLVA